MATGGTIVARASAPGRGRRAVVRMSGDRTGAVLAAMGVDVPARRGAFAARASLLSRADLPVLVLRFVGPRSFTGEDAAELLVPGSAQLVEMLLDRACGLDGVRRAGPGEFSARAYLSGRLTLAEAEGIAALVAADGAAALAAAGRVLSGRGGEEHRGWAERLAGLLALVEAGIDFADQESVVPIGSGPLGERLVALRVEITGAIGSGFGELGAERPLVVLVGRPNAGKSTLFNALIGRERVVAGPEAGTTRDVIVEPLDLSAFGAPAVDLADLPGLDAEPGDGTARDAAARALARADLAVHCSVDGNGSTVGPGVATIRVRTMADGHTGLGGADLAVCAHDGWHIERLARLIAARAFGSRRADDSALIPRHRAAARAAVARLDDALAALAGQEPGVLDDAEVVAGAMRLALDELGEITGKIPPDAVIGRIFASFCIGK